MGVLCASNIHRILECGLWGDGSDGAYTQAGGTVTITGHKQYISVTLSGGAVFGPSDNRFAAISVQGLLDLTGNSHLQARGRDGATGGAGIVAPGIGNAGSNIGYAGETQASVHGIAGFAGIAGGGGGGGVTNRGGHAGFGYKTTLVNYPHSIATRGLGGVGPGGGGSTSTTPAKFADFNYWDAPKYVGEPAAGGGGGGLDDVGTGATTAVSGAGGDGGKAGGLLNIRAQIIQIEAGSTINVNGEDGVNGTAATDATNNDGEAGGGGGGAGGGGGSVWILTRSIDRPVAVTATRGIGSSGGAGLPTGGGTGGAGGTGSDGIVAITVLTT